MADTTPCNRENVMTKTFCTLYGVDENNLTKRLSSKGKGVKMQKLSKSMRTLLLDLLAEHRVLKISGPTPWLFTRYPGRAPYTMAAAWALVDRDLVHCVREKSPSYTRDEQFLLTDEGRRVATELREE